MAGRKMRVRRLTIAAATVLVLGAGLTAGLTAIAQSTSLSQAADPGSSTDQRSAGEAAAANREEHSPAVAAQLDYVLEYWQHYNPDYEAISDNDCVNFTSQSLLARGWSENEEWSWNGGVEDSTAAWRGSTAFRDWLETRPDLATPLGDDRRDEVKVGDIVQFDWDDSGDRDHTGIVTEVTHSASGTTIYYAGHTDDTDYRSVDWAIEVQHPGAAVYYWSIPA